MIRNYRDVGQAYVDSLKPEAAVITRFHHELSGYDLGEMKGFFEFLRETAVPVLGVCGGHQFISSLQPSTSTGLSFS